MITLANLGMYLKKKKKKIEQLHFKKKKREKGKKLKSTLMKHIYVTTTMV